MTRPTLSTVHEALFAALYDRYFAPSERAGLAAMRARLLADAHGRVLEIGAGTGLNLPHYPARLDELVLLEPSAPMARRLVAKLAGRAGPGRVVSASGETLPFPDSCFETVVCTMVLCTVGDPAGVLREIRRVLTTGGQLLFLEHVRSDDPKLARWQDLLRVPWSWWGCGCTCNRRTEALLEAAPFVLRHVEHDEAPRMPSLVRPLIWGRAIAR